MNPPRPEELLAQRVWLRRLAVALVGDSQADDLVQQTVAQALASPPDDGSRLRGWLARVARHFAWKHHRGEDRRRVREAATARDEALPPPEELLACIEEQQVVARAVADLDEPWRSTLLWRYYEDLPMAEIARRTGLTESTVRSRLQRGLERLRVKLEARQGPDWRLAILPIVLPRPAAEAATGAGSLTGLGGLAMTTTGKAALAVAAVVCALVLALRLSSGEERPSGVLGPRTADARAPEADEVAPASAVTGAAPSGRAEPVRAVATEATAPPAVVIEGVVLDTTGRPLANVPLLSSPRSDEGEARPLGTSGTDGTFRLGLPEDLGTGHVLRCGEGYFTLYSAALDQAPAGPGETFVVAAREVAVRGHVLREDGSALEGVEVGFRWWTLSEFPRELGSVHTNEFPRTRTDANGYFDLPRCPGTKQLELHFGREGFADTTVPGAPGDRLNLLVTLPAHFEGEEGFRAVVVDGSGLPLAGALVSFGGHEETTDAAGEVRLPWVRRSATLVAVLAGKQPYVRPRFSHDAWSAEGAPDPVELVLADPTLRITGRVLRAGGSPAADLPVTVERGTHLSGGAFAEFLALGLDGDTLELARTDAEGRFELTGLADLSYVVSAFDPETYECVRMTVPAGTEGAELRFPSPGLLRDVEARCVDGDGRPLAGLEVGLVLQVTYGKGGQLRRPALATTDDQGRFHLEELPLGSALVSFKGGDILDAHRRLTEEEVAGAGPLRFVLPRASRVRFAPSGKDADGCQAGLMGADGTLTTLWVQTRNQRMFDLTWEITDGRSPIYKVDAGEYTLFVSRGAEWLQEETVQIESGDLNEFSVP